LQAVRIGVDITIYPMMIYNQIYVGLKIEEIGALCIMLCTKYGTLARGE
jgi:hypothetical protein